MHLTLICTNLSSGGGTPLDPPRGLMSTYHSQQNPVGNTGTTLKDVSAWSLREVWLDSISLYFNKCYIFIQNNFFCYCNPAQISHDIGILVLLNLAGSLTLLAFCRGVN